MQDDLILTPEEDYEKFLTYEIATYPSDYTLQGIVDLWKNDELTIPDFQRKYVWKLKQASLLIESFLLGLPVPPVFLYVSDEYNNLVVDGQQRLVTIRYFFEGFFGEVDANGRRRVFRLEGLNERSPYRGKTFSELGDIDKRKLKSYVLRAINIRQINPSEKAASSVFHIFERLNTGGTPLKPQEIRNSIFYGPVVAKLREINTLPNWKAIIGLASDDKHERDVELVLRVLSFAESWKTYERPLRDFLNGHMKKYRRDVVHLDQFKQRFSQTCDDIVRLLGPKPFHLNGPLNAAALDSVIGVLIQNNIVLGDDFAEKFTGLLDDAAYKKAIERATADTGSVKDRFTLASRYLVA